MNVRSHADAWLAAWNAHELDAIMDCYADDVEFVASTVVERWGRADGRLRGRAELRRHFQMGLELAPSLHFTEEALLTCPTGYALVYHRENGNCVIDAVELDSLSSAVRIHAYYHDRQT